MFIAFSREADKKGRVGKMLLNSLKVCCKFVRTIALLFAVQALLVPIFSERGQGPHSLYLVVLHVVECSVFSSILPMANGFTSMQWAALLGRCVCLCA